MKPKAIIFDWDGVVVDTLDNHVRWVEEFVKEPIEKEDILKLHEGNVFDLEGHSKLIGVDWFEYKQFIKERYSKYKVPKLNIELVNSLKENFKLFVISSGSEIIIKNILQNNDFEIFNGVFGGETDKSKILKFELIMERYDLEESDLVFITDTLGDILEANELNIKTIGVTFGYHDKDRLEKGNPFKIVDSLEELVDYLNSI